MVFDVYEAKDDAPEEPADPNNVRVALAWHFSSDGTVDFEDSQWKADFDGENGLEFEDSENETVAYIPPGTDGDITGGGSSVTVDGVGDTHTGVSSEGTTVISDTDDINFGPEFTVSDDGDSSATVTTTDDLVRTRQANIPLTEIADTNTAVGLRKQVPSGKTLRILEVGVEDDTGSAPTGLTIEVQDLTNATSIVSQNTRHAEGSPIASKSGAIDVAFRVANSTGGSVNASGYVLYTME